MSATSFAKAWKSMNHSDQNWIADLVGEHLEKNAGVTSGAGRLGRMEGVDSRAVLEAIDYSVKEIGGAA